MRAKRWAEEHPLLLVGALALGWHTAGWPIVFVALAVVWACGWWREIGLWWQRPDLRWLLVLPVAACCLVNPGLAFGLQILSSGIGRYALRRLGPWGSSITVALLFGFPGDMALLFCSAALRWRLNVLWPLLLLVPADLPWWCHLGFAAYGCVLLLRFPKVDMGRRPTVRVLCFDAQDRVLLLGWHDPSDGTCAWDVPGGGINPDETPLDAARRELHEETGLPAESVVDRHVLTRRDSYWNRSRYVGEEPCYLARVDADRPPPSRLGLEPMEQELVRTYRWVPAAEAAGLPGRVQAIDLPGLARRLTASDHWVK